MTKKTLEPGSKGGAVMQTLMSLPGVQSIAKKFAEATLQVELVAPDEEMLALLGQDPQLIIKEAQEFQVTDDDTYKLAKQASDSRKDEADLIEAGRTKGTGPINTIKSAWDSLFFPVKKADEAAAGIYQNKMRAYEKKLRDEGTKKQAEQKAAAQAEKKRLEDEAKELEAKAAKLKQPGKKTEALQQAEQRRATASMIPEEFGTAGVSIPALGSGGSSNRWVGEVTDRQEFLGWLLKNDLWQEPILKFMTSGLNDLAKAIKDSKEVPGFKAEQSSSYRREAKRNP